MVKTIPGQLRARHQFTKSRIQYRSLASAVHHQTIPSPLGKPVKVNEPVLQPFFRGLIRSFSLSSENPVDAMTPLIERLFRHKNCCTGHRDRPLSESVERGQPTSVAHIGFTSRSQTERRRRSLPRTGPSGSYANADCIFYLSGPGEH